MMVVEDPKPIELELAARPESVSEARRLAARFAEEAGGDPVDVELAVAEAVGNCVVHGFPGGAHGTIVVRGELRAEGLLVTVADDGVGMRPNPRSAGLGLGLPLIGRLTTSYRVSGNAGGGTTLWMLFEAGAAG